MRRRSFGSFPRPVGRVPLRESPNIEVSGLMRAAVHESYRYLGAYPAGPVPQG
jgi:hypothetical protein